MTDKKYPWDDLDTFSALELCGLAASGSFVAWPKSMAHLLTSGTPLGWRVNRIGEIIRSVKDGTYMARETCAFAGYYQND